MSENELNKVIYTIFNEIGIPHHLKGYKYHAFAIKRVLENPEKIERITKVLYPEIAEEYGDTWSRVERAMRHAVERSWKRGNINALDQIFGYSIDAMKGRPTNSEFIYCICNFISIFGNDILNQTYKFNG